MSWFKRENGDYAAGGPPDGDGEKSVSAPKASGSSAPAAGRPSSKPTSRPTSTSAPSASTTSKSAHASASTCCSNPAIEIVDGGLRSTDPLNFVDVKPYKQRLRKAQEETGLDDAILNAVGHLGPHDVVVSAMEYSFIGGSMGAVVGETIARAVDRARLGRKPLIVVAASGGARMMEGVVSLMQMAKISTALAQLDDARVPYICVLTDPTTGGVTASFAMLGDLNIAEPGALIGFAGPRVIEQTIRQKLPEGFQRSEFLLEKGFLDAVVHRRDLKAYLIRALQFLKAPAVA